MNHLDQPSNQVTHRIMMIRPANFGYNAETAVNNAFQQEAADNQMQAIRDAAIKEFDNMVSMLVNAGVEIEVIQDTDEPVKPDAIFPNNWISFHNDGSIITYPMYASNRRIERREDIVDMMSLNREGYRRYSLEYLEEEEMFLEGTGSMLLDRANKVVYACASERTNLLVLDKFCVLKGYEAVIFHANDEAGVPIYHTNVIMALGETFAVVCLDCVADDDERNKITEKLQETGKEVIPITMNQVNAFAGNMLLVKNKEELRLLVMSSNAHDALSDEQISELQQHAEIVHIPIPTIEKYGGGSVRCMMAEVF